MRSEADYCRTKPRDMRVLDIPTSDKYIVIRRVHSVDARDPPLFDHHHNNNNNNNNNKKYVLWNMVSAP